MLPWQTRAGLSVPFGFQEQNIQVLQINYSGSLAPTGTPLLGMDGPLSPTSPAPPTTPLHTCQGEDTTLCVHPHIPQHQSDQCHLTHTQRGGRYHVWAHWAVSGVWTPHPLKSACLCALGILQTPSTRGRFLKASELLSGLTDVLTKEKIVLHLR